MAERQPAPIHAPPRQHRVRNGRLGWPAFCDHPIARRLVALHARKCRGQHVFLDSAHHLSTLLRYIPDMLGLSKACFSRLLDAVSRAHCDSPDLPLRARRGRTRLPWVAPALAAIVALGAWLAYERGMHVAGEHAAFNLARFHLGWLLLLALIALIVRIAWRTIGLHTGQRPASPRATGLLAITLFAVPFAGAVGTGAKYRFMPWSCCYMAAWLGLSVWQLRDLARSETAWIAALSKIVIAAFACSQIILGSWRAPYRLNGDLAAQTVPTGQLPRDSAVS